MLPWEDMSAALTYEALRRSRAQARLRMRHHRSARSIATKHRATHATGSTTSAHHGRGRQLAVAASVTATSR